MRVAAAVCALAGLLAVVAGLPGLSDLPPIESIPLARSRLATPIAFPKTPPIRATPPFISTAETPIAFGPWHLATLKRWYLPEPDDPQMGS